MFNLILTKIKHFFARRKFREDEEKRGSGTLYA